VTQRVSTLKDEADAAEQEARAQGHGSGGAVCPVLAGQPHDRRYAQTDEEETDNAPPAPNDHDGSVTESRCPRPEGEKG